MIDVLIDSGNAPHHTGIGTYHTGLVNALNNYGQHEINIKESTITSTSRKLRSIRRLNYLWKLNQLSKQVFGNTDIVHFTNVYVPKNIEKTPFVSTIHDIDALIYPSTYSFAYRLYFKRIIALTFRRAEIILTVSEAVKQSILNRYDFPDNKIRPIGIGLSEEFIGAADSTESILHSEIPTLLFVGSLSVKKNTEWLIKNTVKGVKSGALPRLKLILAGSAGFGFDSIASEMKDAGDIVNWVKNPNLNELAKLYKQSTIFVFPSRTEGFGIPLIEAMYCKKPIVASRIPASVEIASNAAYFFDLDDVDNFYSAIKCALEDRNYELRNKSAAEQLNKYSWKNLVPLYIAAYKEAIWNHKKEK
ncbi:MAG: glycosyltransferase family 1 protein [Bacteroidota bacterium]|nr:glycosyltransferase family 1 protein [Bacteroidota bacterium]